MSVGYKKMERKNKKNTISKIKYWVIYSFIIFLWFLVHFGIPPVLKEYTKLNTVLVTGLIISSIGSALIIISLYSPLSFLKHFFKKNSYEKSQHDRSTLSFLCGLIGAFLILCGFIYSFTGDSIYLPISFAMPIVLHTILSKWNV